MTLAVRIVGVVIGAVFALAGLSVAATLLPLMIVLGLVIGLWTYSALHDAHERRGTRQTCDPRVPAALTAGGTVAGTYVVIGTVVLLGAVLATILSAAVLASVAYRVLRNRRAPAASEPEPAPAEPTDRRRPPPTLLPSDATPASVPELCRAWRVSYLALEHTHDPARLAEIADTRRRYLDELERRDPHGFRRWLDDGARAASDPARYIRTAARQDDAAA